eukprot:TRINITY_DN1455_c1_g1_i1.p2 TRINITY_DN1455_c1_g1~~TRINITY_DN1455_c1_g1_i1.p2  ORF type:complete len:151 (-),score=39.24 TRINITY_DN1455_c1_g1_i1:169-621(-)
MATRASASLVIPLPIDSVWKELRSFNFPARLIPTIESCVIEDGKSPQTVGAVRVLKWKTGEVRKDTLIELSDQYRSMSWELIEAAPPSEAAAAITSLKCYRITETNGTLVEWSCDFSADIANKSAFVPFHQKAFLQNLVDIRKSLTETCK